MVSGGEWVEFGGLGSRGQGRAGAMTILTRARDPHDHASVRIWGGHCGWRPEPGTSVDRVLHTVPIPHSEAREDFQESPAC